MLVKELIELLQTFPQDARVIRSFCSDFEDVEPNQIIFFQKDILTSKAYMHGWFHGIVIRNGKYMGYVPNTWPKDEQPELIDAVYFGGN